MALTEFVPKSTASVLLLLTTLALYASFTWYRNYHKCPQLNGQYLAKISGAWILIRSSPGKSSQTNGALLEKHHKKLQLLHKSKPPSH